MDDICVRKYHVLNAFPDERKIMSKKFQENILVERYESLDCLRGVAAFMVMVGHSLPIELVADLLENHERFALINFLIAGYQWVILFFVLSGFALYLMFYSMKNELNGVFNFLIARWIRLYPLYAISIVISALILLAINEFGGALSSTNNPFINFDFRDLLSHFTLIGVFDSFKYNPPVWSIVHEMRVSIIYPILFFAVVRYGVMAIIPSFFFSIGLSLFYLHHVPSEPKHLVTMPVIGTPHYVVFFLMGSLIAQYRNIIANALQAYSAIIVIPFFIFIVVVFLFIGTFPPMLGEKIAYDLVVGLAASGIIALTIAFPNVIKAKLLLFIGKISFSLYLTHRPVVVLIRAVFEEELGHWEIFSLCILCSVFLSVFMWWFFERFFLRISRAVRMSGKTP